MLSALRKLTTAGIALGLAGAVTSIAAPARALQLIQNGGFETNDFSGWTLTGDVAYTGLFRVGDYGFGEGNYFLASGPSNNWGIFSQDIPTTTGRKYSISFDYRTITSDNKLAASFEDSSLLYLVDTQQTSRFSGVFTASSTTGSSTFSIGFYNPGFYNFVDNVSVEPVQEVPAPLPIMGAISAFALSRNLRRKIKNATGNQDIA